jgi:hypothetical protein
MKLPRHVHSARHEAVYLPLLRFSKATVCVISARATPLGFRVGRPGLPRAPPERQFLREARGRGAALVVEIRL